MPGSRLAVIITLLVGVAMTLIGAVTREGRLLAGILGTVVVVGFFAVGQYVVGKVLAHRPEVAMTTALLVYVLQVLVLMLLLLWLRDAPWLDGRWFGFTVFAGVVAWTVASLVEYGRNRRLTVVPGSGPGHPDGPAATAPDGPPADAPEGPAEP